MNFFNESDLKQLYIPSSDSHKGQNGRVMIVGGSELFHAASLWALDIASKIADMVFYASVPQNNQIVQQQKSAFSNGIVVPRESIDDYMREADAVLIGPGMVRTDNPIKDRNLSLEEIQMLPDEGEQTYFLTKYLLQKYPEKKWVIDAGALQMLDLSWLERLDGNVVLTPHHQEFERVFKMTPTEDHVAHMAKEYNAIIILKGHEDIVCSPTECVKIVGGNAGMTKGGTGDVLAGLIAGLASQNDLFLAAKAASYFNKKAGDRLFEKVGFYFNATDLVNEIPVVMKQLISPTLP